MNCEQILELIQSELIYKAKAKLAEQDEESENNIEKKLFMVIQRN